jgi:hypothetical protein
MSESLRFFLGHGWWVLWHLFLLGLLLPLAAVLGWLFRMQPGSGPQGGDVAFLLVVTVTVGLTAASLVNTLLFAAALPMPGLLRFVKALAIWLVGWPAVLYLLWRLTDAASKAGAGTAARTGWLVLLSLVLGTVYWLNLAALARFHAFRAQP